MVTPAGFEPAIFWMRTRYPGPLDEGAKLALPYLITSVMGRPAGAQLRAVSEKGISVNGKGLLHFKDRRVAINEYNAVDFR